MVMATGVALGASVGAGVSAGAALGAAVGAEVAAPPPLHAANSIKALIATIATRLAGV
jgi:hypothetical protein